AYSLLVPQLLLRYFDYSLRMPFQYQCSLQFPCRGREATLNMYQQLVTLLRHRTFLKIRVWKKFFQFQNYPPFSHLKIYIITYTNLYILPLLTNFLNIQFLHMRWIALIFRVIIFLFFELDNLIFF